MNRKFLLLLTLVCCNEGLTQINQKEFDEVQKKFQKQRDSVLNLPHVKEHMNKSDKNVPVIPGGTTSNTQVPNISKNDKNIEKFKLPPRDSARIKTLPKKNFSLAELQTYMDQLYVQLTKRMSKDIVASADAIAAKLNNQPGKLEATAFAAWQKGALEEALLLIMKGAVIGISDGLLLSNTGAILEINGLSEKAIPVLRTVIQYDKENVIALNNIGQSFTALGMKDSALYYFGRCLSLSPHHPEANNTAGMIELEKGNKEKAQKHFENSIHGSFNISAYTGLKSILKEKCRISKHIMPKTKMPEYFNQFRFKLPAQCTNVLQGATAKEENRIFHEVMSNSIRLYQRLGKEAEKKFAAKGYKQFNNAIYEKASRGEPYMRPFQLLASVMEAETLLEYQDDKQDLQIFNTSNREAYKQLEDEYKNAYKSLLKKFDDEDKEECCGEGDVSCCPNAEQFCREANALKNKFLIRFAQLNEEWQSRNLHVELKHFDNLIYWSYFSAWDEDDYRVRFYQKLVNYLSSLKRLSEIKILEPCMITEADDVEVTEPKELKEFDCPVDIEIPFVVGKISMNCEKFSFKAGEGIVFKVEKKFTGDRQTTISLGAGGGIDASFKLGGIKAGLETGMDMSVFISFEKAGHCTDGGMSFKAYRGIGVDFSAGERLKFKKDLWHTTQELGWRFGINSGVKFTVPFDEYPVNQPATQGKSNLPDFQQN